MLLYHFYQNIFSGGFVGVDIFFTFSGFLITALLLDEFARSGEIDLVGYLRRRFYRIFPPLVLMILLVMPLTLLVRQDYVAGIGSQIMASLGFVTNLFEIISGGSYESQFIPHLFVHTWSLAVEVHYYLFWGLGLWWLSKHSKNKGAFRGSVFLLSSALFFVSFLAMFVSAFSAHEFSGIYFSSVTHIFPFFLGSTLATITGVTDTAPLLSQLKQKMSLKQTLTLAGASLFGLFLLTFFLKFTHISTYLVGFLLASILTTTMILAARLLHEKTKK
ncbi:Acyltransferase family [Streptococcus sp. DD10]|nr:Acyltransferase family [Streptococcus sp. DD10]